MLDFIDRIAAKFSPDLGLDIGSDFIGVCECGAGSFREPSRLMYESENRAKLIAAGTRAKLSEGRTKSCIYMLRPVRNGYICDYEGALELIRACLSKCTSSGILGPRIIASVPVGTADADKQILSDLCFAAGASYFHAVSSPAAAAVGAGIDIFSGNTYLLVDIGAETTQAAILFKGGIVCADMMPSGGRAFDKLIAHYCRSKMALETGEGSSEFFKINCGLPSAASDEEYEIKGKSITSGLPKRIRIKSADIKEIFAPQLSKISKFIKRILQYAPFGFTSGISSTGIVLCGGGANLKGLDSFLSTEMNMPVQKAQDPEFCILKGLEILFRDPRIMRQVIPSGISRIAADFE